MKKFVSLVAALSMSLSIASTASAAMMKGVMKPKNTPQAAENMQMIMTRRVTNRPTARGVFRNKMHANDIRAVQVQMAKKKLWAKPASSAASSAATSAATSAAASSAAAQ